MSAVPSQTSANLADLLGAILQSIPGEEALGNTPAEYIAGVADLPPSELAEFVDPPTDRIPRLGGDIVGLSIEGVNIAVTMSAILIHLWHCRVTVLAAKQELAAVQRLPAVWSEILKRHIPAADADKLCQQFGADLEAILRNSKIH
jgi:hypothetical protein